MLHIPRLKKDWVLKDEEVLQMKQKSLQEAIAHKAQNIPKTLVSQHKSYHIDCYIICGLH